MQAKLIEAKERVQQVEDAEFLASVEVEEERRAREAEQAARVAAEQKARMLTLQHGVLKVVSNLSSSIAVKVMEEERAARTEAERLAREADMALREAEEKLKQSRHYDEQAREAGRKTNAIAEVIATQNLDV